LIDFKYYDEVKEYFINNPVVINYDHDDDDSIPIKYSIKINQNIKICGLLGDEEKHIKNIDIVCVLNQNKILNADESTTDANLIYYIYSTIFVYFTSIYSPEISYFDIYEAFSSSEYEKMHDKTAEFIKDELMPFLKRNEDIDFTSEETFRDGIRIEYKYLTKTDELLFSIYHTE
jgi:hypothetical protein